MPRRPPSAAACLITSVPHLLPPHIQPAACSRPAQQLAVRHGRPGEGAEGHCAHPRSKAGHQAGSGGWAGFRACGAIGTPCPSLRQANYPEHASPCLTYPCCGASHDAFIQIRAAPAPGCLQAPHVAQPLTAPRQQPCQAQAAALRQAPAVPLQLGGAGLAARRELPAAPRCATLVPASSGYTW